MKRLFGQKKAAAPAPTMGDATTSLDKRGTQIDEKVKKLDEELMSLRTQMQKTRGPQHERLKQRAMQVLKQRKMYDSQRTQIYQQQYSMEQLQFTKEMMEDTKMQVQVMRDTSKEMSKTFKKFSVDEVERMQDDLADLYEQHQEIQEVMGRAYGVPDDVDEDDLAEELDALAFDMDKQKDASYLDEALATPATRLPDMAAPAVPAVPEAPQHTTVDPYAMEEQLGL
uniref:Charged multivesicular body protein 5 n=2 Tax=Neobodo designis TaxID=312471 RepID=A0A7S1PZB2_NEODS|mmetsp:Transcript_24435/g.75667  ORF Transcript_24435/g.75667 Transcript_24435/m.75667 type:complete len:226 (+) Transcript_24435:124-801(+)